MKKQILLYILIKLTSQCRMVRDWKKPTLTQQIKNAGIILIGSVNFVPKIFGKRSIKLTNIKYLKGCNKKEEITVDGFKPGNLCGAGIPSINNKIIIFGCKENNKINKKSKKNENEKNEKKNKNKNNDNIFLNSFTSYTGFVQWSQEKENLIIKILGNKINECKDVFFNDKCLKNYDFEKKGEVLSILNPTVKKKVLIDREEKICKGNFFSKTFCFLKKKVFNFF